MGRRKYVINKKADSALGILIVILGAIGLAVSALINFFKEVGLVVPSIFALAAIAVVVFAVKKNAETKVRQAEFLHRQRVEELNAKYNDQEIVRRIIANEIWVGETSEQVIDTLGKPEDVDSKVMKSKVREIWKYGNFGVNRYRLRITLENNIVVGWDKK